MKSLSEIETTSKRASRAAGFSWGVAEEVGKCVRLLELFGLPGIKNLNQYYQIKSNESFEKLSLIKQSNKPDKLSFFGALKFDPRSDKWLRICMFQGAPLPTELKNYDEQWVYQTNN